MVMSVVGWTERSVASAYSFSWVTKEFDTRGDSWMLMSPRVRRVDDLLTVHPDFQLGGAPWERKGEAENSLFSFCKGFKTFCSRYLPRGVLRPDVGVTEFTE